MRKCRKASVKETLVFQHKYCASAETRETLVHHFMVTVEAYEELPPWYSTFNANGSDIRLKDDIIMFRVRDLERLIEYYPVFPAAEGIRLLHKWKMEVPPKLTAFATYLPKRRPAADNASLRSLIAYCRLFMLEQGKEHAAMAFGFTNLYQQLYDVPFCDVSPEAVKLINAVFGEYILHSKAKHYGNSRNLQEFIIYINKFYSLLKFQENNFDRLRKKLKQAYPDEEIYF